MNISEREEELEPGVDFAFPPPLPAASEYWQQYSEAQREWLFRWTPQPWRVPH